MVRLSLGRPSLARRLVVLAAGWSLAVLLVFGLVLTAQFERAALSRFERDLDDLIQHLYSETLIQDGRVVAPALTDARALRAYSGRYWQISDVTSDGEMRVLVRSRSLWDQTLADPPNGAAAIDGGKTVFYDAKGPSPGETLRVGALKVRLAGYPAPVVITTGEDRSPVDADASRFGATIAVALILLGIGIMAAIFIQVRIGLLPLFALRREVAEVRTGKADALAGRYPVELEPLAQELNALLAHNQEVVERQRTHVGNLAHALKTPISVMLSEAQSQPGALAEIVKRQTQAMHGHVEHHLRRARAAARTQTNRDRTPVAPVLDELARTLERIFRDKGVRMDWDASDDLNFQGERQDFQEIVGNVMENAAKWCRGKVMVSADAEGGKLRIVVEDDGSGLPADRREDVFKRGARLDEQTPGSGLGLSIVDELARAYGGAVALSDSRHGGLRVEITLPGAES